MAILVLVLAIVFFGVGFAVQALCIVAAGFAGLWLCGFAVRESQRRRFLSKRR
jgi:hypothetical protein